MSDREGADQSCLHCHLAEALTNLLLDVIETARTPAARRALTMKIAADMVAYGEKSPTVIPEGRSWH